MDAALASDLFDLCVFTQREIPFIPNPYVCAMWMLYAHSPLEGRPLTGAA